MTRSSTDREDRRADSRHEPQMRAAVWFNFGPVVGETCELKDISMSGFSISCDEWQLPVFLANGTRSLYCVLLLGEAHFGCMARMAATAHSHTGRIGFQFDAIPESSIRLVQGLIGYLTASEEDQLA